MSKRTGLLAQVRNYIRKHEMIQAGDLILVGLSGGGDSVCLLCVLKELQEELGISLAALHVHHGIRGAEADGDAEFCQKLCEGLGVRCQVVRVDVPAMAAKRKLSLEEAARLARYRELEDYRKQLQADRKQNGDGAEIAGHPQPQAVRIAVAHHREDQAETVLWNLFRGTGLKGLGGMEPVNGTVIRPLLGTDKQEILSYLEEQGIAWRQDVTNDSDDYTRNRIRHHVLGYAAAEINDRSAEHICQAAAVAAQADGYLRRQAQAWLTQHENMAGTLETDGAVAASKTHDAAAGVHLTVSALNQEEEILQTYILREALARCGSLTDVTVRHMEAVRSLLAETAGGKASRQVDLADGVSVRRRYGELIFEKIHAEEKRKAEEQNDTMMAQQDVIVDLEGLMQSGREGNGQPIIVNVCDTGFELRIFPYEKTQKIPTNQYTKWLNYDKIERTLVFRARRPGDYILLPDRKRKTVKAYMIDEKIPAGEREKIPVVAQGSHVLWIAGYRLSEGAKITEDTQYVLEIKMHGG